MDTSDKFAVVIPAAGIGSRMAAKTAKQYLEISGQTILEHTVSVFLKHPVITKIIVVLHPNDEIFDTLAISKYDKIHKVIGGAQRADSVYAGLKALQDLNYESSSFVLVHDAARPCLRSSDLDKLIKTCLDNTCGGILASAVVDTLKQANKTQEMTYVEKTVDRDNLWQAQTPQMFILDELVSAIDKARIAGVTITDEASAMEFAGKTVLMIEGMPSNIKLTRPGDLELVSFYLGFR